MRANKKKLAKVQFHDPEVGYENLWALPIKANDYRIENIPFFVYGVSLGDIVTALPCDGGQLQFVKVVEPSGHITLRARSDNFIKNPERKKKVIASLKKLGSEVEVLRSRLLAIDVPPSVGLELITDYLTKEAKLSWEYGNPENLNK